MSPRDTCISKEDAQRGLLNLIERQLIPPAADIILSPPPVKSTGIELLSAPQQFVRPSVAMEEDVCGHMVGVKLAADGHMTVTPPAELSCRPSTPHTLTLKPHRQTHVSIHVIQPQDMPTQLSQQIQRGESPTPAAPSTSDPYQITIENGQALKSSQEHHQFQSSHTGRWPHISSVLSKLERLCQQYSIPMATVHSGRLVEVASDHELGLPIRREHLISCFVNSDSVKNYVTRPGQRFKGEGGKDAAAALIQATYRMYCQRCSYLQHQRQVLAVGVITTAWNLFLKRYEVRVRLAERRCRELKGHRSRSVELGKRWRNIQKGKRVIIHIPSLGYQQCVRRTEPALSMEQSLQLARIADVQDPNVEVIYISPVAVDSEILDYYSSLLAMGPNGSETAFDRIHIITPDHLHTFPSHPLPLSTILTLSPQTVKRVKRLTTGREAYIVPGVVNSDDMTIANILGVPLLGPDCEASELYSSKDGAKKIFSDANMPTPPCAMDIVSECQLLEQLAGLVASHPHIHRWLFKLPHQIRGRGFAYCDVADHLQCQQWLERESERYGDNWSSRWAQEQARRRILNELPSVLESHAIPVNSDLYPTWRAFLANFLVSGGLIEGHPPSTSTTSLTVDLFIDPTGEIELLSTQDQICAEGYVVWGVSVPQSSVAPDMLLNSARRVGVTCRGRGIMGHLSIDYVTFIHPKTLEQELWAVDLDLGYSNHLALLRLLGYVTGATVAPSSGQLTVESGPRFAILSPRVYHTNLPVIHYPVFFQTCKAHHIGYDAKEKVGTIFALFDREHKEQIGIICLQPSLSECLACYSTALRTIHQEIATPLVPGTSNFKAVTRELEAVAEQVRENEGTIIAQQTEQNSEENTILL